MYASKTELFVLDGKNLSEYDIFFIKKGENKYRKYLYLTTELRRCWISVRVTNCFYNADIEYVGDLVQKTEEELLSLKNFGNAALIDVKGFLAKHGLSLGMKL